jgi:hypothetical protein
MVEDAVLVVSGVVPVQGLLELEGLFLILELITECLEER